MRRKEDSPLTKEENVTVSSCESKGFNFYVLLLLDNILIETEVKDKTNVSSSNFRRIQLNLLQHFEEDTIL